MKNKYKVDGDKVFIYFNNRNLATIIDIDDLPKVLAIDGTFYAKYDSKLDKYYCMIKNKRLHRIIMDAPKGLQVDHINHDTLDNRKNNLRLATTSENQQNRESCQSNSKSGIRGVCWDKQRRKWKCHIKLNGKKVYAKFFDNIEDAERDVIEARKRLLPFSQEGVHE